MIRQKRTYLLVLPVLILSLAALACGTGVSTTHKLTGNSGEVRVRMKEANGTNSTSVEINEDWSYAKVTATVTLFVESGSCQATISGGEGSSVNLTASAGSPAETYANLVTDGFGEVDLKTDCQNTQNLDLAIYFALQ